MAMGKENKEVWNDKRSRERKNGGYEGKGNENKTNRTGQERQKWKVYWTCVCELFHFVTTISKCC